MFSDTTEETQALRMGDTQLPKAIRSFTPPPPLSLKSELDVPENGPDFYSSPFDNSFPFIPNERTFSTSPSNTSFLSDTSFNSNLKNSMDPVKNSDNFGLLITSTPCRDRSSEYGFDYPRLLKATGEGDGGWLSQGNQLSEALGSSIGGIIGQKWDYPQVSNTSEFDFSFTTQESSFNTNGWSSSSSSDDSPTRFANSGQIAPFASQWNSSDTSHLLDNQSTESSSSSSVTTTSAVGSSIWSPSQVSAGASSNNDVQWDGSQLERMPKKALLAFSELLKKEYENSVRNGEFTQANQIQGLLVQVQTIIISTMVSDDGSSIASTPTDPTLESPLSMFPNPSDDLDRITKKMHREISGSHYRCQILSKDKPSVWSGQLPPRFYRNPIYSPKVFLGGLPWDITESTLYQAFKPFGIVRIEWPGKDGVTTKPKGYAYAIFENEKQVKLLLQNCTCDYTSSRAGDFYFKITSNRFLGKDVQIIPWGQNDSSFNKCQQPPKIESDKTIFVGALHGMVNAEGLTTIMDDMFGGVVCTAIDLDRSKYPIGSARVTFNSSRAYLEAVRTAFVVIKTPRFEKKLQLDPYLEDANCSVCKLQQGPYFCRDAACFSYFCRTCFDSKHNTDPYLAKHRSIMRTQNNKQQNGTGPAAPSSFNQQHGGFHNFNSGNNLNRQFGRNTFNPMNGTQSNPRAGPHGHGGYPHAQFQQPFRPRNFGNGTQRQNQHGMRW